MTGVDTGLTAVNPATGEEIPVYVADFVLEGVGTGALMAVPGHDERDHAFARANDLPIRQVIEPAGDEAADVREAAYTADGVLVNSDEYTGLASAEARERLVEDLPAETRTQYRLRDWLVSRQRYWGTPIPIVHCEDCGRVPVPDEDLPVELPAFVHTAGNPLDAPEVADWREVECPDCGRPAERETDTMDTFVDSSWYFLRYTDPENDEVPFDPDRANEWMPVDRYVGGVEHAVMHLLYARFVTRALADLDMVAESEPFVDLTTQGMVRLEGEKMSKSKGNVVSPAEIVREYGADTARLFMMGAAQPERDFDWTAEGVASSHAFLGRLSDLVAERPTEGEETEVAPYVKREIDAGVAAATAEYDDLRFNRAIREIRELVSLLRQYYEYTDPGAKIFERGLRAAVRLLAPVAPHICEELWAELAGDSLVAAADWPTPANDAERYETERTLVEHTREDVRDIVDVADIEDPQAIELVVAPEWKHRALELAADAGEDAVSAVMSDPEMRERGEVAASFAADLRAEERVQADTQTLAPDREVAVLERAAWLLEREFGAVVTVRRADDTDTDSDLAARARPGRPAIRVHEGENGDE